MLRRQEEALPAMASRSPSLRALALVPEPDADAKLGRRERKRLRQSDELVAAATELFIDRGFDNVNMEDVAVRADVATSTLYKYFPSKRSLLLGIAKKAVTSTAALVESSAGRSPTNVVDAIMEQTRLVWGPPMTHGEKDLWRHLRAASFLADAAEAGSFETSRQGYVKLIHRLLLALKDRELMPPNADLIVLASAIYAIRLYGFSRYVAIDRLSMESALADVRGQVEAVVTSWPVSRDLCEMD